MKLRIGVFWLVVKISVVVLLNICFVVKIILVIIVGSVVGISICVIVFYLDKFRVSFVLCCVFGIVLSVFLIIWINSGKLKIVSVSVLEIIEKFYFIWIIKIRKLNSFMIIDGSEESILIVVWIKFVI